MGVGNWSAQGARALLLECVGAGGDYKDMLRGLHVRWMVADRTTGCRGAAGHAFCLSRCSWVFCREWGWSQGAWVFLLHTGLPGMEWMCNVEVHGCDIKVRRPYLSEPRQVLRQVEHVGVYWVCEHYLNVQAGFGGLPENHFTRIYPLEVGDTFEI